MYSHHLNDVYASNEELSDLMSLPSITLTNDDYFKWAKKQNTSPSVVNMQTVQSPVSRSDTINLKIDSEEEEVNKYLNDYFQQQNKKSHIKDDRQNNSKQSKGPLKFFKKSFENLSELEHKCRTNSNSNNDVPM